jgi:hypothetical protein
MDHVFPPGESPEFPGTVVLLPRHVRIQPRDKGFTAFVSFCTALVFCLLLLCYVSTVSSESTVNDITSHVSGLLILCTSPFVIDTIHHCKSLLWICYLLYRCIACQHLSLVTLSVTCIVFSEQQQHNWCLLSIVTVHNKMQ